MPNFGCLSAVSLNDFVKDCSHGPSLLLEEGLKFLCGDSLTFTECIDHLKDCNSSKGGNSNIQIMWCRQKQRTKQLGRNWSLQPEQSSDNYWRGMAVRLVVDLEEVMELNGSNLTFV